MPKFATQLHVRSRERSTSSAPSSTPSLMTPPNFLRQLIQLIEGESAVDVRDILFWSQDGQYLVIPDEKDFEERVCRIVFSQSKIANFNKQMNNWGWGRTGRKDIVRIVERDPTIWSKNARLWEHATLTRDSTYADIDAVKRHPDGMAKKNRSAGNPHPPARRPRPSPTPRRWRRSRRDESSDEEEAEETDGSGEDVEMEDIYVDDRRDGKDLAEPVLATSFPILALEAALGRPSVPMVPRIPQLPSSRPFHIYHPPKEDDYSFLEDFSPPVFIPSCLFPAVSTAASLPGPPLVPIPPPFTVPTFKSQDQPMPSVTPKLSPAVSEPSLPSTPAGSATPPTHNDTNWESLFHECATGGITFANLDLSLLSPSKKSQPFTSLSSPPSSPSTSPRRSTPIQSAPLPTLSLDSTPPLNTNTTHHFDPSATLLPCLHSTPSTYIDRTANLVYVRPSLRQRRLQPTTSFGLLHPGISNRSQGLPDENTPTRATFGSGADLMGDGEGDQWMKGGVRRTPELTKTKSGGSGSWVFGDLRWAANVPTMDVNMPFLF